jgi:hypothetical protein
MVNHTFVPLWTSRTKVRGKRLSTLRNDGVSWRVCRLGAVSYITRSRTRLQLNCKLIISDDYCNDETLLTCTIWLQPLLVPPCVARCDNALTCTSVLHVQCNQNIIHFVFFNFNMVLKYVLRMKWATYSWIKMDIEINLLQWHTFNRI